MSNIYFCSDSHFSHKSFVEKYGIRKFDNVDQMNETMINRWNEKIQKGDLVYHLGDFSFGTGAETCDIIDRLNGQIQYIRGNHESHLNEFKHKFVWVRDIAEIKMPYDGPGSHNGKISITLSHYPFRVWNKSHYGSLNFFGHVHSSDYDTTQSVEVSVDTWNYYPVSFEEALERMKSAPQYIK